MIRSAFAAYSPGQPDAVVAQLSAVRSLGTGKEQQQRSAGDGTLVHHAEPAMTMSIPDWDMLFCAMTERLRAFAGAGLAQSGGAHEEVKAKMQMLSLDCALSLELLHGILRDRRPGDAAAARKFGDEND